MDINIVDPVEKEHGETIDYLDERLRELSHKYGLRRPKLEIEDRATRTGGYNHEPSPGEQATVYISEAILDEVEFAEETLKHEFAHHANYLEAGNRGHGPNFKKWCRKLGIPARSTAKKRKSDKLNKHVKENKANYIISCVSCEHEFYKIRKSKKVKQTDKYNCAKCGSDLEVTEI